MLTRISETPDRTARRAAMIGTGIMLAVLIRRHAHRHPAIAGLIGLVLAVSVATHLAVLILLAVAGAVLFFFFFFFRNRRASTHAARRGQAALETPERQGTILKARARRNGWLPPVTPKLTTLAVSPECASLDCVACPGARGAHARPAATSRQGSSPSTMPSIAPEGRWIPTRPALNGGVSAPEVSGHAAQAEPVPF